MLFLLDPLREESIQSCQERAPTFAVCASVFCCCCLIFNFYFFLRENRGYIILAVFADLESVIHVYMHGQCGDYRKESKLNIT